MFRQGLTREELGPMYGEDIPEFAGYYYVAEKMYSGKYYEKIMRNTGYSWVAYKQHVGIRSMSRMRNKQRRFLVGPMVKSPMEVM